MQPTDLAILAALYLVPVLTACREHHQTLRIEVPKSFTGHVHVSCESVGYTAEAIKITSDGQGGALACTKETPDIQVTRDGTVLDVSGSMQWVRTGDGLPVGVDFAVR